MKRCYCFDCKQTAVPEATIESEVQRTKNIYTVVTDVRRTRQARNEKEIA